MTIASRWVAVSLACVACGAAQRPDGGEGLLPVGARTPDVVGVDQEGNEVRLRDVPPPVLVFFYPKDGTPGCTKEACAFRDAWDRYERERVTVLGVSSQSRESHLEFSEEHRLPFRLIADPDHVWSRAFGVGTFFGLDERVSFLVGRDGRVAKVYGDVDPALHAGEVLRDARKVAPERP